MFLIFCLFSASFFTWDIHTATISDIISSSRQPDAMSMLSFKKSTEYLETVMPSHVNSTTLVLAVLVTTSTTTTTIPGTSAIDTTLLSVDERSEPALSSSLAIDDNLITSPPSVDMTANFLKELDELDEYMINITKFESVCSMIKPGSIQYCNNDVNYLVPKDLAKAPYFQDSMAKTAVETLSLLTEGGTTQCEKQLRQVFCQQKFPQCLDIQELLVWGENETRDCFQAIQECSPQATEKLKQMKICEKLSKGSFRIDQCVIPMPPSKDDLCSHGNNVSAWLYHSSVEVNSLLQFQFSLNEKLSAPCKQNLTIFMCATGRQCFSNGLSSIQNDVQNVTKYLEDVKISCEETIKTCQNEELSKAITELFLDCKRYVLPIP